MKKLPQVLKNLWYWLPVIIQDRQWDHVFLIKILEHKLRAMDEFFMSDGSLDIRNRRAKEIRYCRILCSRILQDDYLGKALRYHEQRWGEAGIITKDLFIVEIAVPHLTGKDREKEKVLRKRLYDRATRQEDQDWAELFRLLSKQIRGWWD